MAIPNISMLSELRYLQASLFTPRPGLDVDPSLVWLFNLYARNHKDVKEQFQPSYCNYTTTIHPVNLGAGNRSLKTAGGLHARVPSWHHLGEAVDGKTGQNANRVHYYWRSLLAESLQLDQETVLPDYLRPERNHAGERVDYTRFESPDTQVFNVSVIGAIGTGKTTLLTSVQRGLYRSSLSSPDGEDDFFQLWLAQMADEYTAAIRVDDIIYHFVTDLDRDLSRFLAYDFNTPQHFAIQSLFYYRELFSRLIGSINQIERVNGPGHLKHVIVWDRHYLQCALVFANYDEVVNQRNTYLDLAQKILRPWLRTLFTKLQPTLTLMCFCEEKENLARLRKRGRPFEQSMSMADIKSYNKLSLQLAAIQDTVIVPLPLDAGACEASYRLAHMLIKNIPYIGRVANVLNADKARMVTAPFMAALQALHTPNAVIAEGYYQALVDYHKWWMALMAAKGGGSAIVRGADEATLGLAEHMYATSAKAEDADSESSSGDEAKMDDSDGAIKAELTAPPTTPDGPASPKMEEC